MNRIFRQTSTIIGHRSLSFSLNPCYKSFRRPAGDPRGGPGWFCSSITGHYTGFPLGKATTRLISTKTGIGERENAAARYRLAVSLTVSAVAACGLYVFVSRRRAEVRMALAAQTTTSEMPVNSILDNRPTVTLTPLSQTQEADSDSQLTYYEYYEALPEQLIDVSKLPVEEAVLTLAPEVPPSIKRDYPVLLKVPLETTTKTTQITNQYKYEQWTFNGSVPAPFVRARVGDVVELSLTNKDDTGNPHNIDSHAFTGPGGGAALTTAEENETKTGRFKLLCPGLYLYHCAAAPVPVHIANGMYGLMYVQPAEGDLPPVDHEYYVMQSEFYHEPPEVMDDGRPSPTVEFSYPNGMREEPNVVVFNGTDSALTRDQPLKARVGETVRVFFGNAGPNLTSAFHIIGSHFRKVYRDGDVVSPPGRFVQTVCVPPGGATIVDLKMFVPGSYTIVDHAIFRLDKGAVGFLNVSGETTPGVCESNAPPAPCVGCKLHP